MADDMVVGDEVAESLTNGVVNSDFVSALEEEIAADGTVRKVLNPKGGTTHGPGFTITWKDGPGEETEGAQVNDVIEAALQRIQWLQASRFSCIENGRTEAALQAAISQQNTRTRNRRARGVEGTNRE